ncbi:hypothetical protein OA90_12290 [Labrenzia sp. OB1]|nr:hypothetical protein OA90_12290 [Labrenzia sp. OB1]
MTIGREIEIPAANEAKERILQPVSGQAKRSIRSQPSRLALFLPDSKIITFDWIDAAKTGVIPCLASLA